MSKPEHVYIPSQDPDCGCHLRQLLADQQGVAALEFALLLPLLTALALATADFSLLAARTYQVQSLAQTLANAIARLPAIPSASSGATVREAGNSPDRGNLMRTKRPPDDRRLQPDLRALRTGYGAGVGNTHGQLPDLLQIRVEELVNLPEDASATNRLFWGCSGKSVLIAAPEATCPDGSRPGAYAEVVVRAPVNRLLAWPENLLSATAEGRAVVRLG